MDYGLALKPTDITLTFAQSLDGKLAGQFGSQVALSCQESMQMTHWLRSQHKGILVGINTVLNDNPQLNTRLLEGTHENPQPIVLDTHLRFPLDARLLENYRAGTGKQPWIVSIPSSDEEVLSRKVALEAAGARIIEIDDTRDLSSFVSRMHQLGIPSIMVEGGAQIIRSFIQSPMVTNLIITIAPTFLGKDAVGYELDVQDCVANLSLDRSFQLGRDTIVAFRKTSSS